MQGSGFLYALFRVMQCSKEKMVKSIKLHTKNNIQKAENVVYFS